MKQIIILKLICSLIIFQIYITRLYRVHAAGASIHLEPVNPTTDSLDPRYVFVLDTGLKIFIWYGKKCKNTLKSKARLMAEKINKNERKNKAEIITEVMGDESRDFWLTLGEEEGVKPEEPLKVSNYLEMNSLYWLHMIEKKI